MGPLDGGDCLLDRVSVCAETTIPAPGAQRTLRRFSRLGNPSRPEQRPRESILGKDVAPGFAGAHGGGHRRIDVAAALGEESRQGGGVRRIVPPHSFRMRVVAIGVRVASEGARGVAKLRGEIRRRRRLKQRHADGQRAVPVTSLVGDSYETEAGGGVSGKHRVRLLEAPARFREVAGLDMELAELRAEPCERFRIVRAGRVRGHLHETRGRRQVSLNLPGIAGARVRRGIGPPLHHAIDGRERVVVVAQFEVGVGHHPMNPWIARAQIRRAPRFEHRFAKTMLEAEDSREHPAGLEIGRLLLERGAQDVLGASREPGIAGHPRLPPQRLRKRDGHRTIGRRRAHARFHRFKRAAQVFSRRRRRAWRAQPRRCGNGRCVRPVPYEHERRTCHEPADDCGCASPAHHLNDTPNVPRQKLKSSKSMPKAFDVSSSPAIVRK